MRFIKTPLAGTFEIEVDRLEDDRGFFFRTFDRREFVEQGLFGDYAQASISYNRKKGTLRGLHFQVFPHAETKLIRCLRGAVWDVMVDLRRGSPTFKEWHGVELTAESHRAVYLPAGLAHGFITLTDDAELHYQITPEYVADSARGIRWDDPELAIRWPLQPTVISDRDRAWPAIEGHLE